MTPSHPTPSHPTAPRVHAFRRLGARRVALLCSLAVLTMAGHAAAQLPGLPAVPQAAAVAAQAAQVAQAAPLPALPPVAQGIDTPLGSTTVTAQNGTLDACTDDAATVAAPKVPVTLPVSIPAPGVSAQDCVHVDPMQAAADVTTSLATTASGGTIAAAEATSHANPGVIDSIVGWFLGLFS